MDYCWRAASGERRGFVAVDAKGKIWSLSRWCGVKPKELRARLGSEEQLPTIADILPECGRLPQQTRVRGNAVLEARRIKLVVKQREERAALQKQQEGRRVELIRIRKAQMPGRLTSAFLRVTGQYQKRMQAFETAAREALKCQQDERQQLIRRHLAERRALAQQLNREGLATDFQASVAVDQRQKLVLPPDALELSREQLLAKPSLILAHISKTEARFDRTDILRALAKRIDDPFSLRDAADKALASSELIGLPEENGRAYFTTRDFRDAEQNLAQTSLRMVGASDFGVGRQHVEQAARAQDAKMQRAFGGRLSDEQRNALDHILDERQFACIVGLAGAGKSTMLAAASEAWQLQGRNVHGAALAGKAAEGLEAASGIRSRTLASLETSWENGFEPIAKGDVLVIDEAGMIGTRQMARVAAKMEQIGAKLVLVGDPEQLQPIEAGKPFRDLVGSLGAARLTDIYRQREEWQKQASRNLADGRIFEAVEAYGAHGAVTNGADAFEALVETYVMDAESDGGSCTRLAFAHRRRDVYAINQAIRASLRDEDAVDDLLLETETGPRAFGVGDRIVFTRNNKELGVKNGMLGTVTQASASKLTVSIDGDDKRVVTFDPRRYRNFDHGYAVTIHKSQGATVDRAYVLASQSIDRHLAYVAMTRHRNTMQLFVRHHDRPSAFAQNERIVLKCHQAAEHEQRAALADKRIALRSKNLRELSEDIQRMSVAIENDAAKASRSSTRTRPKRRSRPAPAPER